jgi:hypothetical protein
VLTPFQTVPSLTGVSSLQATNASLVLGFLAAAQETASVPEAAGFLVRLEPALDAAGASRMASWAQRLMRAQSKSEPMEWLRASQDFFSTIVDTKMPRKDVGGKAETTLIELLAESQAAMDLLLGNSETISDLHEDYVRRARQLRRLIDENHLSKVRSMGPQHKNAILFILAMEPHIPELLALDDTLNYLSAGVWEMSAAVYGQVEAAGLIYSRLRIANSVLGTLGIEPRFEEKIGEAFEMADRLQDRIHEIDTEAPVSVPPAAEIELDRLALPPDVDPADVPEDSELLPSELARLHRESDGSRVTLGEYLSSKPGAPLAKIRERLAQASPASLTEESALAAATVQSLIDSLDILLESLRGE